MKHHFDTIIIVDYQAYYCLTGLKLSVRKEKKFSYRLNETVLLSTQNMLKFMGKKIIIILRWNFLFI